jgi:hypothetical protein
MSLPVRLVVAVLWVVSLVSVAALARAQNPPLPSPWMTPLPSPIVLSGNDVGFRVEGRNGNRPVGVLVIRMNGEWVVPTTLEAPARLSTR